MVRTPLPDRTDRRDTITLETYNALTDGYMEARSIDGAATHAGVSYKIAEKYIRDGTDSFPPIKDRVKELTTRALAQADDERSKLASHFKGSMLMLSKQLKVLENIELVPRGVVNPTSGKIEVDERTFSQLASAARSLNEFSRELTQMERGGDTGPHGDGGSHVHVHVEGDATIVEGKNQAKEVIRRHARTVSDLAGTTREQEIVGEFIAESGVSEGTEDAPSRSDADQCSGGHPDSGGTDHPIQDG